MNLLKKLFFLVFSLGLLCGGALFWYVIIIPIPDINSFKGVKAVDSIRILDREGVVLFNITEDTKRRDVPLEKISKNLVDATLAIEDHTFYTHSGFRPKSIARALVQNLQNRDVVSGGSTITQQLVKNLLLTRERNITRKLKELVLSIKIETLLSKDEILELYFNTISYGGNTVGIAEGVFLFFGKGPEELTVAESAYLAALPNAPTYYSPYGNNFEKLEIRKNAVLNRMLELGYIDQETYTQAINEWVSFRERDASSIKAPHFVFFIQEELSKDGGVESVLKPEEFELRTTLDYELQKQVQEIVSESREFTNSIGAENMAALVLDAKNGDILAMVGSFNYFDEAIDGKVNVLTSLRQPGSTFKPFIYSAAFENGYTSDTLLFDVPTQFSTTCKPNDFFTDREKGCYAPKNFNDAYQGIVSLRQGLAQSINITAIKTAHLVSLKPIDEIVKRTSLKELGSVYYHGLPVAIGSAEIQPISLASAFTIFPNRGLFVPYRWFLGTGGDGGSEVPRIDKRRVISTESADTINDILVDDVARGNIFSRDGSGRTSLFFANRTVAIKTGTTNDARDLWIVGYSKNHIVLLWAGNNDNTETKDTSSGSRLAGILRKIFNLEKIKSGALEPFNLPVGQSPGTASPLQNIAQGDVPHSILYHTKKNDPLLEYWETGVGAWVSKETNREKLQESLAEKNTEKGAEAQIILNIKDTYRTGEVARVSFLSTATDISRYELYLDGTFLGTAYTPIFAFVPGKKEGVKTFRVVGFRKNGAVLLGEKTINIVDRESEEEDV